MKKLFLSILLVISARAFSQKDPIEKIWYNEEKTSKIQIYKAVDGNFYGKIIWLREPNDIKGKPKVDDKNKNEKLQTTPRMGLLILRKFKKYSDENVYDNGTVYDPNNGKTYCGKLTLNAKKLQLRGYICAWSWFGRTSTWTQAE
jgi:uncharacterized protein (DUF2147 family)